jgi:hypothetical protein
MLLLSLFFSFSVVAQTKAPAPVAKKAPVKIDACAEALTSFCPTIDRTVVTERWRCLAKIEKKLSPSCLSQIEAETKQAGPCALDVAKHCDKDAKPKMEDNYSCLMTARMKGQMSPSCSKLFDKGRKESRTIVSKIREVCAVELAGPCKRENRIEAERCLGELGGKGGASPDCLAELVKYWKPKGR